MSGDGCGDGTHVHEGGSSSGIAGVGDVPTRPEQKRLEINGAPVIEQSHEYVMPDPKRALPSD